MLDIIEANNPHDAVFHKAMSDIRVARGLIEQHMPKDALAVMDQKSLRLCEGTYIEKNLRKRYSDILYRADFKEKLARLY